MNKDSSPIERLPIERWIQHPNCFVRFWKLSLTREKCTPASSAMRRLHRALAGIQTSLYAACSSEKRRAAPKVGYSRSWQCISQSLPNVWKLSYAKICFFDQILRLLARGSARGRPRTHIADNATQKSKCMTDCQLGSARLLAWTLQENI